MGRTFFSIKHVPDLTLNKYSSLEEGDVGGVLGKHRSFLRLIHRLGMTSNLIARWFFEYAPERHKGERLRVLLVFDGNLPDNLIDYLKASPLSAYYDFRPLKACEKHPVESLDLGRKYRFRVTLVKREKYAPVYNDVNGGSYYSVNKWDINDDARLYGLFTLMARTNKPCVYAVSVRSRDLTNSIESPEMLGDLMRNLQRRLRAGNPDTVRDDNADYSLKRYKSLIEEIAANPHFQANIQTFADDKDYADMLLNSAVSEALDEGSYEAIPQYFENNDCFETDEILSSPIEEYNIAPRDGCPLPKELSFWPTLFMLKEIAAFNAFPVLYPGENVEMPKETAPSYEENGLFLGTDKEENDVYFPVDKLTKHAFIAGVPGSGKTNTMLHLVTELYKRFDVPFLVFEPAKKEYRALLNMPGMEDICVFSPSADTKFPLHINPFEFPRGIVLADHIRVLVEVFMGAFPLILPMPILLDRAVEKIYVDRGWSSYMQNKGQLEYPTMSELYAALEKILKETEYDEENKKNMQSMLEVRIGSLLAREMGDMFDVSDSTLKPEEWLTRPVVLELEALGRDQANFATLLITNLIRETLRANPTPEDKFKDKPRHVILFEEAHNLIGPVAEVGQEVEVNPKISATAFIVKMLAEVRALQEAIIIADQLPTKMAPEVIKNTSLKIGHRITAEDDRNLLGGTMSANAVQLERMATYESGEALVFYENLLKPFELEMYMWARDENGNENKDLYKSPDDGGLYKSLSKNAYFAADLEKSWEIMKKKFSLEFKRIRKDYSADNIDITYDKIFEMVKRSLHFLLRCTVYKKQNKKFEEDIRGFSQGEYDKTTDLMYLWLEKEKEKRKENDEKISALLKYKAALESMVDNFFNLKKSVENDNI
jgi:hypothetical protein